MSKQVIDFPVTSGTLSSLRKAAGLLAKLSQSMNLSGAATAKYSQDAARVERTLAAMEDQLKRFANAFAEINREMESGRARFNRIVSATDQRSGITPTGLKVAKQDTQAYTEAIQRMHNTLYDAGVVNKQWIKSVKESAVADAERAGNLRKTAKGYEVLNMAGARALGLNRAQVRELGALDKIESRKERTLRELGNTYGKNAGLLEHLRSKVIELGQAHKWRGDVLDKELKNIPAWAKTYTTAQKDMATATGLLNEKIGAMRQMYPQAGAEITKQKAKVEALIGANDKNRETIGKVRAEMDLYGKTLETKYGIPQRNALDATRTLDRGIGKLTERFPQATQQINAFAASTKGFIDQNKQSREVVGQVQEQIASFGKKLEAQFNDPQARAAAATARLDTAMGKLRERIPQASTEIDRFKSSTAGFITANKASGEMLGQVEEKIAAFGKQMDEKYISPQDRASQATKQLEKGLGGLREKFPQATAQIDAFSKTTAGFIDANKNSGEMLGRVQQKIRDFGTSLKEQYLTPQERALAATKALDVGVGQLSERFPQAQAQIDGFKKTTEGFIAANQNSANVVQDVRQQISSFGKTLTTQFVDPQQQAAAGMKLLGRNVGILQERFPGAIEQINRFHAEQKAFIAGNADSDKMLGRLSERIKIFRTGLEEGGEQLSLFQRGVNMLANRFKILLTYFTAAAAIRLFVDAFRAASNAIIEYSQGLKDLQAITRATDEETAVMGETIQKVAATTKFSIQEVAEGMRTLGQAGFSAEETLSAIQGISDLATGTLSSMATSVDIVTTAIRVFNIDASKASHVADVFANAVNGSKLTIDKLRTSMNFVGPIASQTGVSLEELTATMMVLANQGIRASTIGTSLRQVFNKLAKPTEAFKASVESAGLSLEQLDPQFNSLSDVIARLGIVTSDTRATFEQFGLRGAAGVAALTNAGKAGFDAMLERVNEVGTAAAMAEMQMEGLGIQFKNLRDKLGNLAVAFGKLGLQDILLVIVKSLRALVAAITFLIDNSIARAIAKFAGWGTAILSVLFIMTKWRAVIAALVAAWQVLAATKVGLFLAEIRTAMIGTYTATVAATGATQGLTVASRGLAASLLAIPFVRILAVIGLIVSVIFSFKKNTKELIEENIKLSAKVSEVVKSLKDLDEKLKDSRTSTRESATAYRNMRQYLIEVSEGNGELSESAYMAAMSIDGVTGSLKDGGTALARFRKEAESLEIEKMAEKMELLGEQFKKTTGFWNSLAFDAKSVLGGVGSVISNFFRLISGQNTTLTADMEKLWKNFWDFIHVRGAKTYKELEDIIKNFGSVQTSEQKAIVTAFRQLNTEADKVVGRLESMGDLDLTKTNDEILQMAVDMGILSEKTGLVAEAVAASINRFREISSSGSEILNKLLKRIDPSLVSEGFRTRQDIIEQEWNDTILRLTSTNNVFKEDWRKMWEINNGEFRKTLKSLMRQYDSDVKTLKEKAAADISGQINLVEALANLEIDTLLNVYKAFYTQFTDLFKKAYDDRKKIIEDSLAWEKQTIEALSYNAYRNSDFATAKKLEERKLEVKKDSMEKERDATVAHHTALYELAKKQVERLRQLYANDTPEALARNKEYQAALVEERDQGTKLAQIRLKALQDQTETIFKELEHRRKEYEKHTKDIEKLDDQIEKDRARAAKERLRIESRYIQESEKALKDHLDAIRAINKEITALNRAYENNTAAARYDLERKILDIHREGMTDAQKEASYRMSALDAMARAENALATARKLNSSEYAAAAEQLVNLSEGDVNNLTDRIEKERMLRRAAELLARIKEEQHRQELRQLAIKKQKEDQDYKEEKKRRDVLHKEALAALDKEMALKESIYNRERARLEELQKKEEAQINARQSEYSNLKQQLVILTKQMSEFIDALNKATSTDLGIVDQFDKELDSLQGSYEKRKEWFENNPLVIKAETDTSSFDFEAFSEKHVMEMAENFNSFGNKVKRAMDDVKEYISAIPKKVEEVSKKAFNAVEEAFDNMVKKLHSKKLEVDVNIWGTVNPTLPLKDAIKYALDRFDEMGKDLENMGHKYTVGLSGNTLSGLAPQLASATSATNTGDTSILKFDFGNGKVVGPVRATPNVRDALIQELNKAKRTGRV